MNLFTITEEFETRDSAPVNGLLLYFLTHLSNDVILVGYELATPELLYYTLNPSITAEFQCKEKMNMAPSI